MYFDMISPQEAEMSENCKLFRYKEKVLSEWEYFSLSLALHVINIIIGSN